MPPSTSPSEVTSSIGISTVSMPNRDEMMSASYVEAMSQSLGLPINPNLTMSAVLIDVTENFHAGRERVALPADHEEYVFVQSDTSFPKQLHELCFCSACHDGDYLVVVTPYRIGTGNGYGLFM